MARKHGKPVIIMEPVKGGSLANPPAEIQDLLKSANPDASFAQWAIRYAASLDGVMTVLSGMSNLEQMEDNLSYMKDFKPLDDEELDVIRKAQEHFGDTNYIECTSCHYCTDGCPQNIPIPEIFAARNKQLLRGQIERAQEDYDQAVEGRGIASDCIECEQCEAACPQHLDIVQLLKENALIFDA